MRILKPVYSMLSPQGPGGKLTILIFHRVFERPDAIFPGEPHAAWFDALLAALKHVFNVMPLGDAIGALGTAGLPRAAAITFDDGYEDNFSVAMPILVRHRLNAAFFVATGFLDGGRMWNDTVIEAIRHAPGDALSFARVGLGDHRIGTPLERLRAIESVISRVKYLDPAERESLTGRLPGLAKITPRSDLMMTSEQVLQMRRAGMTVGAHTVTHPILARLDADGATDEIDRGRRTLESILGERVGLFAYPNGKPGVDYTQRDRDIVERLGFDAAVTTRPAAARGEDDRFQLPRFTPWDRTMMRFGVRLALNLRGSRAAA